MACGECHHKDLTPPGPPETAGRFIREIASYFPDCPVLVLWYEGQATVMAGNLVLVRCTDPDDALWEAVQRARRASPAPPAEAMEHVTLSPQPA